MADQKITELAALTTPLAADVFAVVDIAAGPITKKVTLTNLATAVATVGAFVTIAGAQTVTGAKDFSGATVFSSADTNPATLQSKLTANNLYLDGKDAIQGAGTFLRLNNASEFASGVFVPSPFRIDNSLRVSNTAGTDFVVQSHNGTDFAFVYTNTASVLYTGATFHDFLDSVRIRTGNGLSVFDSSNIDSALFTHDGNDFNELLTNTIDRTMTGNSRDLNVGDSVAPIVLSTGAFGRADHAIRLEATTNNDNVEIGLSVFEGVANYRARFFLSDEFGTWGLQASGSSVPNFNLLYANTVIMEVDGTRTSFTRQTGGVRIYDQGATDYLQQSHDGTDFDFGFVNTLDLNITGLTAIRPTGAAFQFVVPSNVTPALPTIAFGDGDTGFYEQIDDQLVVSVGGTARFSFISDQLTTFQANAGPVMRDIDATATVPSLMPAGNDQNTGIGTAAGDQLSLIAGGVEGLRVTETASAITVDIPGILTITRTGGGANDFLELEESTDNNRIVFRYDGSSIWEIRDAAGGAGNDWIRLNEAGGGVDLLHNSTVRLSTGNVGVNIENNLKIGLATFGSIKINEGGPASDEAGYGQIWTRSDTPNTLMFTDDAGTDFIVGGAISAAYTRNATVVEDRTLLASASATTINNNNVLAALIADLQTRSVLG